MRNIKKQNLRCVLVGERCRFNNKWLSVAIPVGFLGLDPQISDGNQCL